VTAALSETGGAVNISGDRQFLIDLAVIKVKYHGDWQQICWVMFEFEASDR